MHKDCAMMTPPVYHSDWLVKYGVVTPEKVVSFLNTLEENTVNFVVPSIDPNLSEYPIVLDDLIDSKYIRDTFIDICQSNRIFPY